MPPIQGAFTTDLLSRAELGNSGNSGFVAQLAVIITNPRLPRLRACIRGVITYFVKKLDKGSDLKSASLELGSEGLKS